MTDESDTTRPLGRRPRESNEQAQQRRPRCGTLNSEEPASRPPSACMFNSTPSLPLGVPFQATAGLDQGGALLRAELAAGQIEGNGKVKRLRLGNVQDLDRRGPL